MRMRRRSRQSPDRSWFEACGVLLKGWIEGIESTSKCVAAPRSHDRPRQSWSGSRRLHKREILPHTLAVTRVTGPAVIKLRATNLHNCRIKATRYATTRNTEMTGRL